MPRIDYNLPTFNLISINIQKAVCGVYMRQIELAANRTYVKFRNNRESNRETLPKTYAKRQAKSCQNKNTFTTAYTRSVLSGAVKTTPQVPQNCEYGLLLALQLEHTRVAVDGVIGCKQNKPRHWQTIRYNDPTQMSAAHNINHL